jgi:hypothetical protein
MTIDSKPFHQTYGSEHSYLFNEMWQREDPFQNCDPFEAIVIGFITYLGNALKQFGCTDPMRLVQVHFR